MWYCELLSLTWPIEELEPFLGFLSMIKFKLFWPGLLGKRDHYVTITGSRV